jgi:hypothetical protein
MTSNLGFNWIRKFDKSLSLPEIIFEKEEIIEEVVGPCSGCYIPPDESEVLVGDKYYLNNRGLILISLYKNSDFSDESGILDTVIHEWRHHWQKFNWKKENDYFSYDYLKNCLGDYDETVKWFYRLNKHESDALLFARKYQKSFLSELHYELFVSGS